MADDDTWLSLGEAAAATGWKPERIRSLARRGTIARRRGNTRDWLYQITPELVAARAATRAGTMADPSADTTGTARSRHDDGRAGTTDAARWEAAELHEEVAELRVKLARAQEQVEAARAVAAADVAAAQAKAAALRELIDELKAQLAEARRPWWRRLFGQ
jgi:hypothetical protein